MPGLIAVTGGGGFLGAHAVRALARRGWRIRALARRWPGALLAPDRTVEIEVGDLADPGALRRLCAGADAILHVAGLVKARRRADFFTANAAGTQALLEAAATAAPTARLIHVSSIAARVPDLSPYAASKRQGELAVERLAGSRSWLILRPPAIYGPGDLELLPLFRAARSGLLLYPAARKARLAFIHVADLAAAIARLAEGDWPDERVLEIDDGSGGYSWPAIAAALSLASGRPIRALRLPRLAVAPLAFLSGLAAAAAGQARLFRGWKVPELYHADWSVRASPLPTPSRRLGLAEGFSDTLAWYRENSLIR